MRCKWIPLALLLAALLAIAAQASPQQQREAPAIALDRWNRMSPEVRERELAKLPPATARLIRQRLRRYNNMSPEEQEALRQRYQSFSQLPPPLQQLIRDRLREFRQLPPQRQRVVYREIEQLRPLPEAQRQAHMNDAEFRSRFSPPEQQIIRDVTKYLEPPMEPPQ